MAEGRTKVYYLSDILTAFDNAGLGVQAQFVVDVPNNLVAQAAALGWSTTPFNGGPTGIRLPKRLRPRHVVGVSSSGKRIRANIAAAAATLWATPGGTWTYIDNFGTTQTATVTGLVGEAATLQVWWPFDEVTTQHLGMSITFLITSLAMYLRRRPGR